MNNTRWIVITDLDGTLLDHHTYDAEPAMAALTELSQRSIPVIINSSKTAAEIKKIQSSLMLSTPFITENGSAIVFNDSRPPIVLGKTRASIIDKLSQLPSPLKKHYLSFNELSVDHIASITGLSKEMAELAAQREYSEPIYWQGEQRQLYELTSYITSMGLSLLQGGRFFHVLGNTDKGHASLELKKQYLNKSKQVKILALGDSLNDLAMLRIADQAVAVSNPNGSQLPVDDINLYRTSSIGPNGWAEAVEYFILNNHE